MEDTGFSRGRRWWIIGGAALLALIVLLAIFSLGVYVGRRGWDADPPAVAGPGQQPLGGLQPPGGQPPPGGQQPSGEPTPGGQLPGGEQPSPGGQPPAGYPPLDEQPQNPWPQDRPALVGPIRSISAGGLTIGTQEGPRFVQVGARTRYVRLENGEEVEIAAESLHPGQGVAVFGRWSPDGRTLMADRIVLLPPKEDSI